ncbi:EAL domain-containing protein [Sulfurimonas sp. SAG-AH-194-C21]|nr:EAL domain-containing protein [Sulfurimonas sp. SAG-AH-194-C21]MDF1882864.1 EAL domain-containing protein [Sulfurimonas sp. SAG-AH-194-C21]
MKNFTFDFIEPEEVLEKLNGEVFDTPQTLIQLFCTTTNVNELKKIQSFFADTFTHAVLIGTTSDGIINASEVYTDKKSVVTFTIFNQTILRSTLLEHSNTFNNSYETGKSIAQKLLVKDTKLIISFTDGLNTNGEEYAKGISSVSSDVILSGGLAGDNGELHKTYVFTNNEITSNGAVGVSLSGDGLNVKTNYSFDWLPVGKELRVTKAINNRVYEIEGMTTVDIYAKYMGHELAARLPQIGIEFPLVFEVDGVLVGRAVLLKHDDGSLTFAGNIHEGTKVRFGIGDIADILKNISYKTRKILSEVEHKPEAVFVYSCMARRRFMKEYMQDELEILSNIGAVSGFFTYGEFYHEGKCNQLLNETMTMLVLSEEKNTSSFDEYKDSLPEHEFSVDAQHVMAHLANTVSTELAELNSSLEKRIQESADYIYQQAYFDKLTGLPNRLSLIKKLNVSLGKMIILINIDDFTMINDFYGHKIGDEVLKKLAFTLQMLSKEDDAELFKLPSDEFAIITYIESGTDAIQERIINCIRHIRSEEFLVANGHYAHVSVTIAAALINDKKTGLINADMTLKLAKQAGKEYLIFNEDFKLAKHYESNINMANTIKHAISSDKIFPHYQPIIDVKTRKIQKYEALVRLEDENGQLLSPYAFLEVSRKIKLYPFITEIMIEKSFSYFKKNGFNFSINLSFSDITNERTREFIFAKIKEYGIASQLTIEILETQENDNLNIVTGFINNVYEVGASIAIDDFGSGFANFEHMTTMRSDIMKIDGSLIKNIDTDKNARLVVETIIVFAKKLGKKIVAEFVHNEAVYKVIQELEIDYAQGYYLGKPEAAVVEDFIFPL